MEGRCRNCGAVTLPDQIFCVQCGERVEGFFQRFFRLLPILKVVVPYLLVAGLALGGYLYFRSTIDPAQVVGRWEFVWGDFNDAEDHYSLFEFSEDGTWVRYGGEGTVVWVGGWKVGRGNKIDTWHFDRGRKIKPRNEFRLEGENFVWGGGDTGWAEHRYLRVDPSGHLWLPPAAETTDLSKPTVTPKMGLDPSAIPAVYYYGFNTRKAPFDRLIVRMTFSCAVYPPWVLRNVSVEGALPAETFVPPQLAGYSPETVRNNRLNCPSDERSLIELAGYHPWYRIRQEFPAVALVHGVRGVHRQIAELIKEGWDRDLFVDVTLRSGGIANYRVFLREDAPQIFAMEWVAEYNDPISFLQVFHSQSPHNYTHFSNPTYDRLVDAAAVETDEATRNELLTRAEIILLNQAVVIPIYHYTVSR